MRQFAIILVKYKKGLFLTALSLIAISAYFCSLPSFSGSLSGFKLENNWHFHQFKKADSLFGDKTKLFLIVKPSSDDRDQVFDGIRILTRKVTEIFPTASVVSPLTFYSIMKQHWQKENSSLASFFDEAQNVPILNQLIARDRTSFLIIITSDKRQDFEIEALNTIIETPIDGISSTMAFSSMHIEDAIKHFIERDVVKITLLILIFFFLYIILVFRNLLTVVFTFVIVATSVLACLILFAILEMDINLISILAIPIVLILSISDALHLMAGYVKNKEIIQKNKRIEKVIQQFFIPSLFSSATTAAAFFSFYVFNESPYIKEFGLVTSIALMVEVFLAFTISPYLLYKFNISRVYDANLNGLADFFIRVRKPVSIGLLSVSIISLFIVNKIEFKSSNEIFFPRGSELYEVHEEMRKNYISILDLNIFLKAKSLSSEDQDALRRYMRLLSKKLEDHKLVVKANASTDNYMFKSSIGVPVNLYGVLGKKNPYYDQSSGTYRIEVRFARSDDIVSFYKSDLNYIIADVPENIEVTYSSLAILMDEVNKSVTKSLIQSLSTSGIVIFFMILLLTRSIKISLFSLAPNIVPLAFVIVVFFIFNISLNIITAVTAVICLGLLDDDSVHILYRKLWLKEDINELSFSILSSAILLIVGFGIFLVSSFKPIRVLGWVSAMIFFIGVVCEMTLMQWVLDQIPKKFKK